MTRHTSSGDLLQYQTLFTLWATCMRISCIYVSRIELQKPNIWLAPATESLEVNKLSVYNYGTVTISINGFFNIWWNISLSLQSIHISDILRYVDFCLWLSVQIPWKINDADRKWNVCMEFSAKALKPILSEVQLLYKNSRMNIPLISHKVL